MRRREVESVGFVGERPFPLRPAPPRAHLLAGHAHRRSRPVDLPRYPAPQPRTIALVSGELSLPGFLGRFVVHHDAPNEYQATRLLSSQPADPVRGTLTLATMTIEERINELEDVVIRVSYVLELKTGAYSHRGGPSDPRRGPPRPRSCARSVQERRAGT